VPGAVAPWTGAGPRGSFSGLIRLRLTCLLLALQVGVAHGAAALRGGLGASEVASTSVGTADPALLALPGRIAPRAARHDGRWSPPITHLPVGLSAHAAAFILVYQQVSTLDARAPGAPAADLAFPRTSRGPPLVS
jgi:hypothetical protein